MLSLPSSQYGIWLAQIRHVVSVQQRLSAVPWPTKVQKSRDSAQIRLAHSEALCFHILIQAEHRRGTFGWTKGQPANKKFYEALQKAEQLFPEIGREELLREVGR